MASPERDLVDPEEFIALAEASGAIVPLGHFVLETAAQEIRAACQTSDRDLFVSVNVSAVQIQQPDFLEEVEGVLATQRPTAHAPRPRDHGDGHVP